MVEWHDFKRGASRAFVGAESHDLGPPRALPRARRKKIGAASTTSYLTLHCLKAIDPDFYKSTSSVELDTQQCIYSMIV